MLGLARRAVAIAAVAVACLALDPAPAHPATAPVPADPPPHGALTTDGLRGPLPPPRAGAQPSLEASLEDYLGGRPGTYGVAARNLSTGDTALVNADRVFPAASTYKVLVMYRVCQQLADGELTLETPVAISDDDAAQGGPGGYAAGETLTVDTALEAMITVSDNAAAWALARTVGGWDVVTSAASELGMTGSYGQDDYYYTTPADMLGFFQALAGGQLVSADASQQMISRLERQQKNDRIPALLPGVPVAHKTGELPGVRNDAGIVYGPGATYVIAVYAEGADEGTLVDTIARVSRMVYDYHNP